MQRRKELIEKCAEGGGNRRVRQRLAQKARARQAECKDQGKHAQENDSVSANRKQPDKKCNASSQAKRRQSVAVDDYERQMSICGYGSMIEKNRKWRTENQKLFD